MTLPAAGRYAIIATTVLASLTLLGSARAQSLFNTRGTSGQSQASAAATTGSLFSRIGVPQLNNAANQSQGASGSFVGRSNRGFVGGGASSQSSSAGGENRTENRSAAGLRSGGEGVGERAAAAPTANGEREGSSRGGRRTQIVPRHRIAFEFPAKPAAAIDGQLTAQLANLALRNPDFARINAVVESDGLVKLRGQVPSVETRKLAAIMVGLEPGVRSVQNELTVGGDHN